MALKSSLFSLATTFLLAGGVEAEITTEFLAANRLNFTCTILKHTSPDPSAPTKELMLLHGFPMFRVWWDPLLSYWDALLQSTEEDILLKSEEKDQKKIPPVSVHAVACDLRGYSPGASPDSIEEYDYSIFAEDTFALAKAAGFEEGFDLLGHDHGAGLAWYIAENDPNNLILSLTTISVPHIGLMSNALCGDNVDQDQIIASNYFNQFSMADSAYQNNASMTSLFQSLGLEFLEPTMFQKMLWWYNGSLAKHWSMPAVVSDAQVDDYEATYGPEATWFVRATRDAIPMEERPCTPVDAKEDMKPIEIPTLFVCGLHDYALLCNNSYATDFPPELLPNYEHVNFQCGHDFFLEGNCNSMDESHAVMDKATAFLFGGKAGGQEGTADGTAESIEDLTIEAPASGGSGQGEAEDASLETIEETDESLASGGAAFLQRLTKLPMLMASGGTVMASSSLLW